MPAIRALVAALICCAGALLAGTASAQVVASDWESRDVVLAELTSPEVADYPPLFVLAERQDRGLPLQPDGQIGDSQAPTRPLDYRDTGSDGSNGRLIDRVVDP